MAKAKSEELKEQTRQALVGLTALENKREEQARLRAQIQQEVKALCQQMLGKIMRSGGQNSQLGPLPLLCGQLLIEAQEIKGTLLVGNAQEGGGAGKTASGYQIEFTAGAHEPNELAQAQAVEVANWRLPDGNARFLATVSGSPKLEGKLGALVSKIQAGERHEKQTREFWGGRPADFSLAWGALLWEDMKGLEGKVKPGELAGLQGELGAGIRKKELVIERDAGADRPDYSLCLPSFEVRFRLGEGGACAIRSICMHKKTIFGKSDAWIYRAEGEGASEVQF